MVEWGNTQSMFQITLALNLAYFSLREIRTPAFTRQELEMAQARNIAAYIRKILSEHTEYQREPFMAKRRKYEATLSMHEQNLAGYERPYEHNMAVVEGQIR